MPRIPGGRGGKFGKLATVGSFVSVIRELSLDDIREQALRSPRLLILAADADIGAAVSRQLTGVHDSSNVEVQALDYSPSLASGLDAIVVVDAVARVAELGGRFGAEGPAVVGLTGGPAPDEAALDGARQAIAVARTDRAMALGRAFPAFRIATSKALIEEAARANAQFAFVSNLPSLLPIVGGIISASADMLVLTKNQLLLAFKLAAVHGRDLSDEGRIFRELIPIAGAAPIWRTIAREATSFLPFAAGTIPKVAIAYGGTLAAGYGAEYYYRFGRKPSRSQVREFYRQASEAAKKLPHPGRNHESDDGVKAA